MKATSKATPLIAFALLISGSAMADLKTCSEPAQICSADEGGTVEIDSCSVTCAEGVAAVCTQGNVIQISSRPSCVIESENDCHCNGDERKVETHGDHE